MSKDPSNPFAQLNARDFPSRNQRGNQPAPRARAQGGKTVVKEIVVPGKIINIVVK